MMERNVNFTKMVDKMVLLAKYDPELEEGIKWLDHMAQKRHVSFYDMVFEVLYRKDTVDRAKKWIETRN